MTNRTVVLEEAGEKDSSVLDNMIQLYLHDFSEFEHEEIGADGRFKGWIEPDELFVEPRRVFLIRSGSNIAGFAVMSEGGEALHDPEVESNWLEEFFILRAYRKRGVGEAAARELFTRFDGVWEVGEVRSNLGGIAFWRKIIERYTSGAYEEIEIEDDRWSGLVQYFGVS